MEENKAQKDKDEVQKQKNIGDILKDRVPPKKPLSEVPQNPKPKPSTTGGNGIDYTSVPIKKYYEETYKNNYISTAKDKEGKSCAQIWPEGKDKGIPIVVHKTHMSIEIPEDQKFKTKADGTKELTSEAKKSLEAMADAVIAAIEERIKSANPKLNAQEQAKLKNNMWATGDKASVAYLKNYYEDNGYEFKDDPPQAMKDMAKAQEEAAKKAALGEAQKNLGEGDKSPSNPLMNMPGFPGGR